MIIYTCKDTFESIMTCIYDAWASKEGHDNIRLMLEPVGNLELFCEYRHVEPDPEKTRKVVRSIQRKISFYAYQMVFRCAMSPLPDKADIIYRFLLLGFAYPDKATSMLQHPFVISIFEANRKVTNETHLFREFTCFSALPNGILVAHIEPKSNLLTLLYPAFDDRMPSENWMIIDDTRKLAAIHEADTETYLTDLSENEFKRLKQAENQPDPFIDLWQTFFHTISIKERKNPTCQRTHLPIWYRKHMTEFRSPSH